VEATRPSPMSRHRRDTINRTREGSRPGLNGRRAPWSSGRTRSRTCRAGRGSGAHPRLGEAYAASSHGRVPRLAPSTRTVPPGMRVAHLDGVGSNDRLENLALAPYSAGIARARAATRPGARGAANAMLGEAQVTEIRAAYAASGVTQAALAARFGVHQTHVSAIVRGTQHRGR